MPVLAYCVTTAEVALKVAQTGVAGMTVESVDESGLRCFVSRRESELPMSSLATREEALAFHSVLQELFRQTTIIPFRFPTLLADEALSAHLREHAGQYRDTLARLKNMVQMEIHLGCGIPREFERFWNTISETTARSAARTGRIGGEVSGGWRDSKLAETRFGAGCSLLCLGPARGYRGLSKTSCRSDGRV